MKDRALSTHVRQFVFVGVVILYLALGINTQLVTLTRVNPPKFMEDYDIFHQAFKRVAHGMDPYEIRQTGVQFLYPPSAFFVFGIYELIASEDWRVTIYIVSNLVALAAIVWRVGVYFGYSIRDTWWWFPLAFGFSPFLELLYVGQVNLITEFGVLLMLVFAETLSAASGLGLWLAIVTKLTPAAYFAYLVAARSWRAIAWTIIALLISFAASTLLFGTDSLIKFFQVFGSLQTTFYGEYDSQALVPILVGRGWIEQRAWIPFQEALNYYGAALCLASAVLAWRSRQTVSLFIVLGLATTIVPSNLWYNRYVLLLLPIFVWIAWSRFDGRIIAWCLAGLLVTQVGRQPIGEGLLIHLFVHSSLVGIVGWQIRDSYRASPREARLVLAGTSLALVLVLAVPFRNGLSLNANLIAARDWIGANLPSGSRIAYDAAAPPIRDQKFMSELFPEIAAQTSDWYERNGFEYLVLSSATYEKAFRDPASELTKKYTSLFDRLPLIARFQNGLHEIRIYQTNPTRLPEHRQAESFGLFAEWLEFVGYDLNYPSAELFWRVVQPRRESIMVRVRLLDRSDQLVDQVDAELFGSDERWRQEIVTNRIRFPSPHPVGIYHIELELESKVSGLVPVLSSDGTHVSDRLVIAPIKLPPAPPMQAQIDGARISNSRFGEHILLSRFSIASSPSAGRQSLKLRLYWLCEKKGDTDYTVFVHLVDSGGRLVAQTDSPPLGGAYPVSDWDTGELIPDELDLVIPRDLASGEYRVEIGLYQANQARLKIVDAKGELIGDHLMLDTVVVK